MNFFKRLFRRPAIFLVTLWARRTYNEGVRAAEERHRREHRTIYLAANSFRPDHLVTYDKAQFKTEKRVYGTRARLLTMQTLARRCYYHTANGQEQNGLDEAQKGIRRRAFIKERLRMSGLLK